MPTTLTSLVAKLADRLQDTDNVLSTAQRESAVLEAVQDYARFRPRALVADLVGNGTADYALPAGWVLEFSALQSLELPLGDIPPTSLEDGDWTLYRNTTTTILRLLNDKPSASQTMRLTYTVPHSVTASASTLPVPDEDAVVNKAAAIGCTWIAAHYAQQGQATLSADVTNHESKSRQYRELAKAYQGSYNNHMGIDTKDGSAPVAAASAVSEWDSGYPWGGDRLTHPRRWF